MAIIKDGTGSGDVAEVDNTNKIQTRAVTTSTALEAANKGEAVFIATGSQILTSATQSCTGWFKNTSARNVIITNITYVAGEAASATSGTAVYTFYKNATGITGTTGPMVETNLLIGDSTVLDSESQVAGEGGVIIGGDVLAAYIHQVGQTVIQDTTLILPPGQSVAVAVTPPTGNTAMISAIAITVYYERENV